MARIYTFGTEIKLCAALRGDVSPDCPFRPIICRHLIGQTRFQLLCRGTLGHVIVVGEAHVVYLHLSRSTSDVPTISHKACVLLQGHQDLENINTAFTLCQ